MIFDAYSAWRTSSMKASASSTVRVSRRSGEPGCRSPLRGLGGQRPREHRLGDARHRDAEIERGLHGPDAGALRAGLVEDDVDERLAGLGVDLAQHLGGDLDEVALELALVPLGEDVGDLGGRLAGAAADQVVRLGDELHVGVLDAVVDHLHEVARAVVADVGDARLALGDGGDRAQDRSERRPGLVRSARHDRRPVQRALLAAGDAGADEVDAGGSRTAFSRRMVSVNSALPPSMMMSPGSKTFTSSSMTASVPAPGLHHDQGGARLRERCGEGRVVGAGHEPGLGMLVHQRLRLLVGAVEDRDGVPGAAGEVAGEVGAHHRQSDDSDIGCFLAHGILRRHRSQPRLCPMSSSAPSS